MLRFHPVSALRFIFIGTIPVRALSLAVSRRETSRRRFSAIRSKNCIIGIFPAFSVVSFSVLLHLVFSSRLLFSLLRVSFQSQIFSLHMQFFIFFSIYLAGYMLFFRINFPLNGIEEMFMLLRNCPKHFWRTAFNTHMYCFSFHSPVDECASSRSCAEVHPRCAAAWRVFSLQDICFRRRNHRDGTYHLFYTQCSGAREGFSEKNPSLFRCSWLGVMCRSGFSCVVYPSRYKKGNSPWRLQYRKGVMHAKVSLEDGHYKATLKGAFIALINNPFYTFKE